MTKTMTKTRPRWGVIIALVITTTGIPAQGGKTWKGKVVSVASGDTITVRRGKTRVVVRLHGADTPEPAQPHGAAARRFTRGMVLGTEVSVKPLGKTRRGEQLARVSIQRHEGTDHMSDGSHRDVLITRFVDEDLLRAGLAWWHRARAPRARGLARLEAAARKARRGLWADAKPVPPWTWRKTNPPTSGCYQQCLDRRNAEAIAFAAIQASCRRICRNKAKPPSRARSKDRSCKKNSDCVVAWDPCSYRVRPCKDSWREAINRTADRRHQAQWASKKPACRPLHFCKNSGKWLGTRALCIKGQCTIRP